MRNSLKRVAWLGACAVLAVGCPKPAAQLTAIRISPENARIPMGQSLQFVANGVYSDGSTKLLTDQVEWLVDDVLVATVNPGQPGLVNSVAAGGTNVRARLSGIGGLRSFNVVPADIQALQLYPPRPIAPIGLTVHVQVIAIHSDNTIENVTDSAIWTSADPTVFTVGQGLLVGVAPGTATLSVTYQGAYTSAPIQVTNAALRRLDVDPARLVTPVGVNPRLAAVGTLTDNTSLDLTETASWSSSAPTIAFATDSSPEKGTVVARAKGTATISALVAGMTGQADVTVSDAALTKLEVTPQAPAVAKGTSVTLTATAFFSDGTTRDVTRQASWTTDQSGHVSLEVAAPWTARGVSEGAGLVKAMFGTQTATTTVLVSGATLTGLELDPAQFSLARGTTRVVKATGIFSDGSTQDLSTQVTWTVDATSVAAVSNVSGTQGLVTALDQGSAVVSAVFGGKTGTAALTVTPAVLTGLQLTPGPGALPVGTSRALTLSGLFSDGSNQDLTSLATWSSTDPSVISVSSSGATRGKLTALHVGASVIHAAYGGLEASAPFTVTNAVLLSLSLSPNSLSLARGSFATLTLVGVYSDNSTQDLGAQASWSSDDPSVGTVSSAVGHAGEVAAVAVGVTTIRAQLGGLTASLVLTVTPAALLSIELSPVNSTVVAGLTVSFTAVGTYSDHTTQDVTAQATWSVDVPAVVSISNAAPRKGQLTALQVGGAAVTARVGTVFATTSVTVSPAVLQSLVISPPLLTVTRGTTTRLHASGTYTDGTVLDVTGAVTWTSSDSSVLSVSNDVASPGVASAAGVGQATVTAVLSGQSATLVATVTPATLVSLELTPLGPQVPLGAGINFSLVGRYSDGSTQDLTAQANWTSSTPSVASFLGGVPAGRAVALARGASTVAAGYGNMSASTTMTVTAATLETIAITPSPVKLAPGTLVQLTATGRWTDGTARDVTTQATWATGDGTVATVSNIAPVQGRVTAQAHGLTTISASIGAVAGTATVTVSAATLLSLAVTPSAPSLPAGLTQVLTATGLFSDGSTQDLTELATWTSADPSRAVVSNATGAKGTVTGLLVGTTGITANALGVTSPVITLTVTSAQLVGIDISPARATVPAGLTQALVATGSYTDGSSADLTELAAWSSSDASVATVSNASGTHGRTVAVAQGLATITAVVSGFSASSTITVSKAQLVSLDVNPVVVARPLGVAAQFHATGTYTDGSTQDLTEQATWASSASVVADVSNSTGTRGLATTLAVGTASVSASLGALSSSATLTVTPAQLVTIGVTPVNPSVPLGLTQRLTATGVYTDGTTQNITAQVTWTTSDAAIATVSNAAGSAGLVTSHLRGVTTVTATLGLLSGSTTVTVSDAALQALQITPHDPSLPAGFSLQLTVTGVFSDSTTQDLTSAVTWGSTDTTIVAVSNGATKGLALASRVGSATVSAALGSVVGTTSFTVTPAVLQAIQVTPVNVSRPKGFSQQFIAMGTYSNSTTQDLTASVTWTSSDPTVASISNAVGSEGLAATLKVGTTNISAGYAGVSGSTPFSVTAAVLVSVAIVPANAKVPLGSVRALSAIGTYSDGSTQNLTAQASWTSSNPSVVSVSNAVGSEGVASTIAIGQVTITVVVAGQTVSTLMTVTQATLSSIDLTPSAGSTALGYTRQFIAIGTYTDGTTQVLTNQVTWTSSDPSKAFISNALASRGLMSTVATGTISVSATYGGITGVTSHSITPAVLVSLAISPDTLTLSAPSSQQLTATGSFSDGSSQDLTTSATWSSDTPSVAQVSNTPGTRGLLTALSPGRAIITVTSGAQSATASVQVP